MKATITTIRMTPYHPTQAYHEAKTDNEILIVFQRENDGELSLSDVLEFDLERVDTDQVVKNITTGKDIYVRVDKNNVHDLQLPAKHGGSRFPDSERRAGE
jgi:hypothetical protein